MDEWRKSPRGLRILLPLGAGAVALLAFSTGPVAQMSEIDAFQRAITTQNKQDALAFIDGYGSSHLVPDLIDLLEPDVAAAVCDDMRNPSTRARSACEKVQRAVATAPAAGTAAATVPTANPVTAPAITQPAPAPAPATPAATAAPVVKPATPPAAAVATVPPPAPTPPSSATAPSVEATAAPATAAPAAAPTAPIVQAPLPAPTTPPATTAPVARPTAAPATASPAAPTATVADAPAPPPFEVVVPVNPATRTVSNPTSATARQTAAVPPTPPIEQEPAATTPAANSRADTMGSLTARFDRGPFTIDHVDRDRGEMVVTYAGQLANYVACGDAVGSVGLAPAATIDSSDRLNSRMIIRLAGGNGGSTRVSVDAIHIVSLRNPASQSLDVVNLRLDDPARTSNGDYCWSTGEMERLAQLK